MKGVSETSGKEIEAAGFQICTLCLSRLYGLWCRVIVSSPLSMHWCKIGCDGWKALSPPISPAISPSPARAAVWCKSCKSYACDVKGTELAEDNRTRDGLGLSVDNAYNFPEGSDSVESQGWVRVQVRVRVRITVGVRLRVQIQLRGRFLLQIFASRKKVIRLGNPSVTLIDREPAP